MSALERGLIACALLGVFVLGVLVMRVALSPMGDLSGWLGGAA